MKRIGAFINKQGTVSGLQAFQILRFAGIFITGILLAKGPVSIPEIGIYERLLFITSAVSFFWVTGILNGLLSKIASQPEESKRIYIFNSAILIIFINCIICAIVLLSSHFFSEIKSINEGWNMQLLLLYLFINTPTLINEYILLIREKTKSLFGYGIFTFSGFTAAVVIPFYLGYGINGVVTGLILFATLKLLYTFQLIYNYSSIKIDFEFMRNHLRYTLPLILSFLLSGSSDYIDGFLVSTHFGSEAFAIFRYGAREFPVSLLLASGLSTAMVPVISSTESFETGLLKLKKSSLKLMHFLFPLTILLMIVSTFLYPVIFRKEFIASAPVFNIYLLLLVSRMVFPQTVVMAKQATGIVFKIAFIEILVNVIASYFLMLKFGIIGVAWGTIIAYYVEKILLAIYLYRKENISPKAYLPLKQWFIYSMVLFFIYLFVENFV